MSVEKLVILVQAMALAMAMIRFRLQGRLQGRLQVSFVDCLVFWPGGQFQEQ